MPARRVISCLCDGKLVLGVRVADCESAVVLMCLGGDGGPELRRRAILSNQQELAREDCHGVSDGKSASQST